MKAVMIFWVVCIFMECALHVNAMGTMSPADQSTLENSFQRGIQMFRTTVNEHIRPAYVGVGGIDAQPTQGEDAVFRPGTFHATAIEMLDSTTELVNFCSTQYRDTNNNTWQVMLQNVIAYVFAPALSLVPPAPPSSPGLPALSVPGSGGGGSGGGGGGGG